MRKLKLTVQETINKIVKNKSFLDYIAKYPCNSGDMIILNNSFLYRDNVKTRKSELYLAVVFSSNKTVNSEPYIIQHSSRINSDFSYVPHKKRPATITVDSAIKDQLKTFGYIPFILIGTVDDSIIHIESINNSDYNLLKLDPQEKNLISITANEIIINRINDPEKLWNELEKKLIILGKDNEYIEKFKDSYLKAFQELARHSFSEIKIPSKSQKLSKINLISSVINSLKDEYNLYLAALNKCQGDPLKDKGAFNEILRISYNFSSDVMTFLIFIISLCDLKPILLWCTMDKHFDLLEKMRNLPWAKTSKKESFQAYIKTINESRNATFHKVTGLEKALEMNLPESTFKNAKLRIFSDYNSKKEDNQLSYADKELIEVLLELSRTSERPVSPSFWEKNALVMESSINLLLLTSQVLDEIRTEMP